MVAYLKAESRTRYCQASADDVVRRPVPLDAARAGDVAFLGKARRDSAQAIQACTATLLIVPAGPWQEGMKTEACKAGAIVTSERPRLEFIRIVQRFFDVPPSTGVHPTAIIHPDAKLHPGVHVGPHAVIGKCFIDEGSVIQGGARLYDHVRVGRQVLIHSGVVLGADGFGFERNEDGTWAKFPHLGGVVVEDNVEIGANTCIDRGALADTHIGAGTKIDNLVHIAHNVRISRNCIVTAGAIFAGSVQIEEDVWVGPGARVLEKLRIGRGAKIGMGAIVLQNVPPGATVAAAMSRSFKLEK